MCFRGLDNRFDKRGTLDGKRGVVRVQVVVLIGGIRRTAALAGGRTRTAGCVRSRGISLRPGAGQAGVGDVRDIRNHLPRINAGQSQRGRVLDGHGHPGRQLADPDVYHVVHGVVDGRGEGRQAAEGHGDAGFVQVQIGCRQLILQSHVKRRGRAGVRVRDPITDRVVGVGRQRHHRLVHIRNRRFHDPAGHRVRGDGRVRADLHLVGIAFELPVAGRRRVQHQGVELDDDVFQVCIGIEIRQLAQREHGIRSVSEGTRGNRTLRNRVRGRNLTDEGSITIHPRRNRVDAIGAVGGDGSIRTRNERQGGRPVQELQAAGQ